uniref:DDE_Tnp_IS1595 domain-containing protein n=1 Tax=Trichuris muris TaxID=70415 RepID=A0A5S6Q2J4_TRIMR
MGDENVVIRYLQDRGLLHSQRTCTCGYVMKLTEKERLRGRRWRCNNRVCRKQISLRSGTWFEGYKVDFCTAVKFMYSWSHGYTTIRFCCDELDMSKNTAIHWNLSMRDVAAEVLMRQPLVIGGTGLTVEVDETVYSKRKYQRGRLYPQQWVFGGICRETKECFLVRVPDRSSRTLIPLIQQYVRPGTTVITDCWRGYDSLSQVGYTHQRVNHSANFVNPVTGAHTQTIESLWAELKRGNKLRKGTDRSMVESYLCQYMWRRTLRPRENPFERIVADIATCFPLR